MAKYSCSDEEIERRFDEILSKLPKDFVIKWVERAIGDTAGVHNTKWWWFNKTIWVTHKGRYRRDD